MKHLKHYSYAIGVLAVFLLLNTIPVSFGATPNEGQMQVPLVVDVSHAIAGVEFVFEYSAGLEFVSYEKSTVVSSALNTPVVVKNGRTYLGFYNVDNRYVPENGKLDAGYLIFNRLSNDSQVVKLTEIKLVQVIDKDTTRSELLAPVEINIASENNLVGSSVNDNGASGGTSSSATNNPSATDNAGGSSSGAKNQPENSKKDVDDDVPSVDTDPFVAGSKDSGLSVDSWIVIVILVIVACGAGVFIFLKKRVNPK